MQLLWHWFNTVCLPLLIGLAASTAAALAASAAELLASSKSERFDSGSFASIHHWMARPRPDEAGCLVPYVSANHQRSPYTPQPGTSALRYSTAAATAAQIDRCPTENVSMM